MSGQVAIYGLAFTRNLILARLLTKTDFGLAAALSMAMTLLEFVSKMAFGRQIIQDPEGDDPYFQSVAHATQMVIGLASALIVMAGAYPMAIAFGVPELTWAFCLLSLIPLCRGAMHLDIARVRRKYHYGPGVLCEVAPQALATAAAWPLAVSLCDFRAVLWIMLGKEIVVLALSHLLSQRAYRWAWQGKLVKRMLLFGWPLLLNGLVMFASRQGDHMLVGANLSLADLAVYSIGFTLSSLPFIIFAQVGSSLMLPTLSSQQNNPDGFKVYYRRCLEVSVIISLLILGPMILAGGDLVRLFYGSRYEGCGGLVAVFSSSVALRFFRWAPSVAAMSRADTINHLFGNIARSMSLLFAFLAIASGIKSMELIAACGLIGEILAIHVSVTRVKKKQGIDSSVHFKPFLYLIGWIAVGAAANVILEGSFVLPRIVAVVGLIVGGIIAALFIFPETMSMLRGAVRDIPVPAFGKKR